MDPDIRIVGQDRFETIQCRFVTLAFIIIHAHIQIVAGQYLVTLRPMRFSLSCILILRKCSDQPVEGFQRLASGGLVSVHGIHLLEIAPPDLIQHIRDGFIDREEGLALVEKYDGEFPQKYFQECLDYMQLSEERFWEVIDSAMSPHLWEKAGREWRLRHAVYKEGRGGMSFGSSSRSNDAIVQATR